MADPQPTPQPADPAGGAAPPAAASAETLASEALKTAEAAVSAIKDEANGTAPAPDTAGQPKSFQLPELGAPGAAGVPDGLELLADVNLQVKIELGRTRMLVEDVLRLNEGSVVELDKLAGDPVDIYVNDRHIARGEVLVLNDNFCVRINEIVTHLPAQ